MTHKTPTILQRWKSDKLKIVDKESARLGFPNETAVGVIGADHRMICKFNDKDSQRYRHIWQAIQVLCVEIMEGTASGMSA